MDVVTRPLPSGVVTLVLGDLQGSVDLWERDREAMAAAMARADDLVDEVAGRHAGVRPTEQGEGDNFVVAFARVSDAVACACELQRRLATEPWPGGLALGFRMGVHTGELAVDGKYRYEGPTMNRCARIRDLAHGGQTLLSGATAALVADAMPDDTTTRHLGAHELRGMTRPEDLYQLCHPDLDDAFPMIASSESATLPAPASTFVGRSVELNDLQEHLATSRVVTITGAGGSGKSRLALELARAHARAGSAWLAELASIRDPLLVPRTVADAVRAELAGGVDPVDAITRRLRGRRSLLVLDNCEHLLEASAGLVSTLARACPDLTVLATSREALAIDGEIAWRIPSLSMPDAVTLFVDRARRTDTGFDLTDTTAGPVAEICQQVDRLPLAIELAAARCRALGVEQIAASLHERFRLLTGGTRDALPRQRSLEASVGWSYDLLEDLERRVLARLSVFAGSFGLEGAAAVCAGGPVDTDQVLDAITSLVDRSLLQVEPGGGPVRYQLLETVRVFARDRLAEIDDPPAVRDRHLEFALELATAGAAGRADGLRAELDSAAGLRAELDTLRSAIAWAGSSGRPEQVIDLIADLEDFWRAQSMHHEIDRALRGAIFSDELTAAARARGMAVAVFFATFGGDFAAGFDFANDACAFAATAGDGELRARATALRAWAGVASGRGTNDQIAADIDTALAECERSDPDTAADSLVYVGSAQIWWSSIDDGRATLEHAMRIAPDGPAGAFRARPWLLNASADGRVQALRDNADVVLAVSRALGSDFLLSGSLQLVAWSEALYGHEEPARHHAAEAIEIARRTGAALMEYFALRADAIVEHRFGSPRLALAKALDALERARHMRLGVNERIDEWLAGAAARRAGDTDRAREHFESALVLATDPAMPFVAGRAHLGLALLDLADDDVDAAWQHGHDGLEVLAAAGDRVGALDALDLVAAVAARSNTGETAVRLLGAAAARRDELGIEPFTLTADERQAVADAAAAELDDVERHRAEGATLSYDDAVAYARRGRGERNRPASGWQSLTPTEIDVVRLVANGLPNVQIGEQLLMSVNTVKTHLTHAYTKLGISSRTELAAQATHRL